jgi:hypothetical protein
MFKLRITDHQGKPSTLELQAGDRKRVGRSDQNDIVLADPSLSRRHAEIYDDGGVWMLTDCGSRNGTLVNGRAIAGPVQLEAGVQVTLGASKIALEDDVAASSSGAVIFHDRPLEATGTMVLSPDDLIQEPRTAAPDRETFNQELERIRKRLAIVEKANLELLAHESVDVLLPKVLDVVFEAVKPERAALVQREAGGDLICRAYRGNTQEEMTISRTIANTVIDQRVSVLTSDAQTDERFANGASIMAQGIQAVMAVPLWNSKKVIGLVYADSRLSSGLFDEEDLRLLTVLANIAAIQIENAALFSRRHPGAVAAPHPTGNTGLRLRGVQQAVPRVRRGLLRLPAHRARPVGDRAVRRGRQGHGRRHADGRDPGHAAGGGGRGAGAGGAGRSAGASDPSQRALESLRHAVLHRPESRHAPAALHQRGARAVAAVRALVGRGTGAGDGRHAARPVPGARLSRERA